MPGLRPEPGLLEPRRKQRQILAQRAGQLRIGRAYRHQHFSAALGQPHVYTLPTAIDLDLNFTRGSGGSDRFLRGFDLRSDGLGRRLVPGYSRRLRRAVRRNTQAGNRGWAGIGRDGRAGVKSGRSGNRIVSGTSGGTSLFGFLALGARMAVRLGARSSWHGTGWLLRSRFVKKSDPSGRGRPRRLGRTETGCRGSRLGGCRNGLEDGSEEGRKASGKGQNGWHCASLVWGRWTGRN